MKYCNLALSCDRKLIASAIPFHQVGLWCAETLKLDKLLYGHSERVTHVAFSPVDAILATCSLDKKVFLWKRPYSAAAHVFADSTQPIVCVEFSPDGSFLASSNAEVGEIILRNVHTKQTVAKLHCLYPALNVKFTPDGSRILAGSLHSVTLWSVDDGGRCRWSNALSSGSRVTCVDVSPDGRLIASAAADGTVTIWEEASGQTSVLYANFYAIIDVQFVLDGQYLATISRGCEFRLLHVATLQIVRALNTLGSLINRSAFDCNSLLCVPRLSMTHRPILPESDFVAAQPLMQCGVPIYVVLDIVNFVLAIENGHSFQTESTFCRAYKLSRIQQSALRGKSV